MSIAELIEAVEAGARWDKLVGVRAFYTGGSIADCNAHERLAFDAYSGSLDAAMALHEALLPGWWATLRYSTRPLVTVGDVEEEFRAQDDDLARAWLLAILRAKEAGQ